MTQIEDDVADQACRAPAPEASQIQKQRNRIASIAKLA
jgi:hypothetical protein